MSSRSLSLRPSRIGMLLVLLVIMFFSVNLCHAQILAERVIHWSEVDTVSPRGSFLGRSLIALSFERAISTVTPPHGMDEEEELSEYPSRDQAWDLHFAELIDVYRWESRSALSVHCSQELFANARNDIAFNPRAAIWQEELTMSALAQVLHTSSSLSLFHRCKHDIDNSDQEEDDIILPGHVQKRTIILGGAALTQSLDDHVVFSSTAPFQFNAEGRVEYYFYHQDYRYPLITFGRSWENLRLTAMLNANLRYNVNSLVSIALRAHTAELYFIDGPNRPAALGNNLRVEAQCTLNGTASDVVFSVCNERLFDNVVRISADPTNTWSFGVQIRPHNSW